MATLWREDMITEQRVYATTQGKVKGIVTIGLTPQAPMDTYELRVDGFIYQYSQTELIQMHSVLASMLDQIREIA
jgi:hypothetical protein